MTAKEFAASRGITATTLYWWRSQLGRRRPATDLVPVEVVEHDVGVARHRARNTSFELHIAGGLTLRITEASTKLSCAVSCERCDADVADVGAHLSRRGATDMRKSVDGLSAVTRQVLEHDPVSGHLFVFCNGRRDRIKILYWERTGFWLLHKRLERGTFAWPVPADGNAKQIELASSDLAALLRGLDLRDAKRRRWYSSTS
jgi:transposase